MAKKPSGLGRGLGDLFDDNSASVGTNASKVVIRNDTHSASGKNAETSKKSADLYDKDRKPKNKSVLSNYR
ncbi:MAG: hypothetical protein ACI3XQ_09855 [Eubacteriales bacterium]